MFSDINYINLLSGLGFFFLFVAGLLLMIVLLARHVRGGILIGLVVTTVLAIILESVFKIGSANTDPGAPGLENPTGWALNVPSVPEKVIGFVNPSPLFHLDLFGAFSAAGAVAAGLAVFSLLLSDFFDTMVKAVQQPSASGLTWCNDTKYKVMAAVGDLGYVDCSATAWRPAYLPPGAPRIALDAPAWVRLDDGRRVLELPTTHSLGSAARSLAGALPPLVHVHFHDYELIDARRRAAIAVTLALLARRRTPVDLAALEATREVRWAEVWAG